MSTLKFISLYSLELKEAEHIIMYVLIADPLFLQLFNVETGQPRFHQTV